MSAAALETPEIGNTFGARTHLSRRYPRLALRTVSNVSSCGVQPPHTKENTLSSQLSAHPPEGPPGLWGHGPAPAGPRTRRLRPSPARPWFPAGPCAAALPFPRARPGRGGAGVSALAVPVSPRSPCRRGCCAWAAGPGVPLRAGSACSCGRWWAAARPRRGTAAPRSGLCTAQVTHPGPRVSRPPPPPPAAPGPATAPALPPGREEAGSLVPPCGLRACPGCAAAPLSHARECGGPEEGSGAGQRSGVQVP